MNAIVAEQPARSITDSNLLKFRNPYRGLSSGSSIMMHAAGLGLCQHCVPNVVCRYAKNGTKLGKRSRMSSSFDAAASTSSTVLQPFKKYDVPPRWILRYDRPPPSVSISGVI